MASNGAATAYDAAVAAAATQPEKDRLQAMRLRFNIPPDSPEWQFYAVLAPVLAPAPDAAIASRIDRIEAMLRRLKPTAEPIVSPSLRDLIVAAVTVCVMIVVAVLMGAGSVPFTGLAAAFVLGVAGALAYVYFIPMVRRR